MSMHRFETLFVDMWTCPIPSLMQSSKTWESYS